jgi:hypothetical protein
MIIRNKYKFLAVAILCIAYYFYPYSIEGIGLYNKVWAHRVNSVEKLNSALNYFDGIELDLVYDAEKEVLDVNHPPTKSIGLNFENYLNEIEKDNFPYIWLDIKNINKGNAKLILEKLLALFNAKNYPLEKVLIESRKANELLIFEKEGFKTSFYLPPDLYKKDSLGLSKSILEIKDVIITQPNIAISASFKDYDIISKEFPNHTKYIWALVKPLHFRHFQIRKIMKDKSVKVVLLNYHVIWGNR